MSGGKSTSTIEVVQPGAANTKGALQVAGEVVPGSAVPVCRGALLAGSRADAACKSFEEEHHQLLGER